MWVGSIPVLAQKAVPAFPRDGARNVLDNATVAIWDVTWPRGKSTGPLERRHDQVMVTLTDGAVRVTRADSTWVVEHSRVGSVQDQSKGTVAAEEGVSDRARRAMVFEIKSYTPPPVPADVVKFLNEKKAAGIPGQFDEANGGVKLFENEKITVWQKTSARYPARALFLDRGGLDSAGRAGSGRCRPGAQPPCPLEKAARTAEGWPRTPSSPDECQASPKPSRS